MTNDDFWSKMKRRKLEKLNRNKHEVNGIHPFVGQILNHLLKHINKYQAHYCSHKLKFHDGSNKSKKSNEIPDFNIIMDGIKDNTYIPDFNIIMHDIKDNTYNFNDLLFPIECKKVFDDIKWGLIQVLHFAVQRILYQMYMKRDYKASYHCYYLATDGEYLAIGKVIIDKGEIKILGTTHSSNYLPLKNFDKNSNDIPSGILAIYYMLLLSPEELGIHPPEYYKLDETMPNINIISILGMINTTYIKYLIYTYIMYKYI